MFQTAFTNRHLDVDNHTFYNAVKRQNYRKNPLKFLMVKHSVPDTIHDHSGEHKHQNKAEIKEIEKKGNIFSTQCYN